MNEGEMLLYVSYLLYFIICLVNILKYSLNFISETMNETLQAAKNLLSGWEGRKKLNWKERRIIANESWETNRKELFENYLKSSYAVSSITCQLCKTDIALIRCFDCHDNIYLCGKCDIQVHALLSLHDRQTTLNGYYESIPPNLVLNPNCTDLINIGIICLYVEELFCFNVLDNTL